MARGVSAGVDAWKVGGRQRADSALPRRIDRAFDRRQEIRGERQRMRNGWSARHRNEGRRTQASLQFLPVGVVHEVDVVGGEDNFHRVGSEEMFFRFAGQRDHNPRREIRAEDVGHALASSQGERIPAL